MKMPTIAYSTNEGPLVAEFHKNLANPEKGFKYFMPRSNEEVQTLLSHLESGQIQPYDCLSSPERLWFSITRMVQSELMLRCLDQNKQAIDEFLGYFKNFILSIENFSNAEHLTPLFYGSGSLCIIIELFIYSTKIRIDREPTILSWESCYVPYVVEELDDIINKGTLTTIQQMRPFKKLEQALLQPSICKISTT
jgi:hypothetical protein